MQAQLIYKISLVLTFLLFANQTYSQTEQLEIIRGQIADRTSKAPLPFANVFIKLDSVKIYTTTSDLKGNFEFKAPVGKHTLEAYMIGYNNYTKQIKVQKGDPIVQNITLYSSLNQGPPWESSKPYPELHGVWKPSTFQIEGQTIDHSIRTDNPSISFYFADPDAPGQISWYDGCNGCGSLFFRHLGDGTIETQKDGLASCTVAWCPSFVEFGTLIGKMKGKETKTTVLDEGKSLEIRVGEDKFTFIKIHDNSQPELSTELHGTWTPILGELNEKKVNKFAEESTITFGLQTGFRKSNLGSIQYVNGSKCSSDDMIITYRYLDEDFISFHFQESAYRPDCCKNKFGIGAIVRQFSSNGCTVRFDESSKTVTLENEGNMLKMKRWVP